MNKITWLHLSDLHISRDSKDKYRLDIIVDSLISDIMDQIRIHNLKLDFVFVSGDISFKGCKDELAYAETVFHKIAEAANISTENIFFVPGNHDIVMKKNPRCVAKGRTTPMVKCKEIFGSGRGRALPAQFLKLL